MLKLNLIIADEDKAYIESIVGFLMDKHPDKFQVNSFTNRDCLLEFLSKCKGKANILLITPEFYDKLKYDTLESKPVLIFCPIVNWFPYLVRIILFINISMVIG